MRIIRNTNLSDLSEINEIYAYARQFMKESGNPTQWGDNRPSPSAIEKDIRTQNSYVVLENDKIIGVFSFINGHDETYDVIEEGAWLNDEPYGVIHKIAGAPNAHGILADALEFAGTQVTNLRIDTHKNNTVMQHLLSKAGFQYCGIIYTDDGTKRLAYQKILDNTQG